MVTWYNHPYYPSHFEKMGYKVSQKFLENYFFIDDVDITKFARMAKLLKARYKIKEVIFDEELRIEKLIEKNKHNN